MLLPDEVDSDYDPDKPLEIETERDACDHYESTSSVEGYSLSPGEVYSDQIFKRTVKPPVGVCYIEYTVRSDKWWWRGPEYKSQVLTVPVEFEPQEDRSTLLSRLGIGGWRTRT